MNTATTKLCEHRHAKGLTIRELAEANGVNMATLSLAENRRYQRV